MFKGNTYRYIGALITAVVLFGICAYANGLFAEREALGIVSKLTDCFTIAGMLLSGAGALSWASSKGAYDVLKYGVDWLIKPFTSRRFEFETLYDFKQRKAESRKPWNKEMLLVGLCFLAVAILMLIVYFVMQ